MHASRYWCIVISSTIFLIAQLCAIQITTPSNLVFVSSLTGLAYGFLFGVFPSLVAEAFGVHGLSQNWGVLTLAPVISGNVFNLFYGIVYDHHSTVLPGGERDCPEGLACYRSAYWVTFAASLVGLATSLWCIQHQRAQQRQEARLRDIEDRDA